MLLMQLPTTALIGSTVKPNSDKKMETWMHTQQQKYLQIVITATLLTKQQ